MVFAGRTPTKDEQDWLNLVGQLPCIVCTIYLDVETPACIHHMEGKTKVGAHYHVLPLCPKHHQQKCNLLETDVNYWISRHGNNKTAFENFYEPEQELLFKVQDMVTELKKRII